MTHRASRPQFESRPQKPDPVYAHKLQELVGEAFGEMSVTMQYLFQGRNRRMPPQPDGRRGFGYLTDPEPLGDVASAPPPDPKLYATYDGSMGEPEDPQMATEAGPIGQDKRQDTMRYFLVNHRIGLAPALCLVLVTAISACSSGGSSSTQNPQYAQGSFSAAPSQVHPTAQSAPAVPANAGPSASAGPSPSVGGTASATSAIIANWKAFFSSSTPNSKRVQLLQNGSEFSSSISAFSSSPLASAVTSTVDSVTLTSTTEATVKYDLSAMGTTVAKGASGTSVLQDGTWKVGDGVFCGLLSEAKSAGLTIPVPAACGSAS